MCWLHRMAGGAGVRIDLVSYLPSYGGTSHMTDGEFLILKQRYYSERSKLPRVVGSTGTPGATNNQEQFALRWGFEEGVEAVKTEILRNLFGHRA